MSVCAGCGKPGNDAEYCESCRQADSEASADPGWYLDDKGEHRYWDGSQWTVSAADYYAQNQTEAPSIEGDDLTIHTESSPDPDAKIAVPAMSQVPSKQQRKQDKAKMKAEKRTEKEAQKEAFREQYGDAIITDEAFGGKFVSIYDKGFVRLRGVMGLLSSTAPERLLGVEADTHSVQKKTALGRTVAAGVTLGASWLLSPNKRGDLYLTIVTDSKTYQLHSSPPTQWEMQALQRIMTAGESVLSRLADERPPDSSQDSLDVVSPADVAAQLHQLASLHQTGALSDEEFQVAKDRVLGR